METVYVIPGLPFDCRIVGRIVIAYKTAVAITTLGFIINPQWKSLIIPPRRVYSLSLELLSVITRIHSIGLELGT